MKNGWYLNFSEPVSPPPPAFCRPLIYLMHCPEHVSDLIFLNWVLQLSLVQSLNQRVDLRGTARACLVKYAQDKILQILKNIKELKLSLFSQLCFNCYLDKLRALKTCVRLVSQDHFVFFVFAVYQIYTSRGESRVEGKINEIWSC